MKQPWTFSLHPQSPLVSLSKLTSLFIPLQIYFCACFLRCTSFEVNVAAIHLPNNVYNSCCWSVINVWTLNINYVRLSISPLLSKCFCVFPASGNFHLPFLIHSVTSTMWLPTHPTKLWNKASKDLVIESVSDKVLTSSINSGLWEYTNSSVGS